MWNPAAAMIVLVGSLLAILISTPTQILRHSFMLIGWLFVPPNNDNKKLIEKLTSCGHALRKGGPVALEKLARAESEPLLKQALSLIANGEDLNAIEKNLYLSVHNQQQKDQAAISVYEHWAGYLPTLGIVGAVMGLMQVLTNLQQPDALGQGIATAFVATFYGIGVANIIMAPVAERLNQISQQRVRYQMLMIDLVARIQSGKNPNSLRDYYSQVAV